MLSPFLHRCCLSLALLASLPALAVPTCPDDEIVDGIDVSKWQGAIDWDQVAGDGIDFAFIRVNHGLEDIDERFDENWAGAAENGVLRGAYQYFLNLEDPLAQAELFLERMGPLGPGDLPPVLDVEDSADLSPAALREAIWTWIDRVESELGVKPILYSYRYYWQTRIQTTEFEEAGYPFWFANITDTCPDLPPNASRWDFWQRSWTGNVAGISGDVDLDIFNGSPAELTAFTVAASVCGDGRCTGDEDAAGCAVDCEGCLPVGDQGRILDDTDACASFAGAPEGWRWNAPAGHGGSARWTYAYAGAQPDNYGVYTLHFEVPGTYRLSIYVDQGSEATSTAAPYRVRHAGQETAFVVDQGAVNGWHELGILPFAAGEEQWVRLDDSTGEPFSERRRLVFDAVRLEPVALEVSDAETVEDSGVLDSGVEDSGVEDSGVDDAGGDGGGGGGPADAGGLFDGGVPGAGDEDAGDGGSRVDLPPSVVQGCSCVSPSGAPQVRGFAVGGLLVGLVVSLRRRRGGGISRGGVA